MPAVWPGSLMFRGIYMKRFRALLLAVRFRYRRERSRYERTEPMPRIRD